MLLLIDHHDSFTHNLEHLLRGTGHPVEVRRPEEIDLSALDLGAYRGLVLSPGPGAPEAAHTSHRILERWPRNAPLLGVCLGMQILAQREGALIRRLPRPVHGKTSRLDHDGEGLYRGLCSPLEVMRYHSLRVDPATLPPSVLPMGWAEEAAGERILMGLRWRDRPWFAVQFHPESFRTPEGSRMIAAWCEELNR